jgi:hypothetical protein
MFTMLYCKLSFPLGHLTEHVSSHWIRKLWKSLIGNYIRDPEQILKSNLWNSKWEHLIFFFCGTEAWTQGLYLELLHQHCFVTVSFFEIGSHELFAILLICASWVARITGESHQRSAENLKSNSFNTQKQNSKTINSHPPHTPLPTYTYTLIRGNLTSFFVYIHRNISNLLKVFLLTVILYIPWPIIQVSGNLHYSVYFYIKKFFRFHS